MLFEQRRARGWFTCFCHESVKFSPWRGRIWVRAHQRKEQQWDTLGQMELHSAQDNHCSLHKQSCPEQEVLNVCHSLELLWHPAGLWPWLTLIWGDENRAVMTWEQERGSYLTLSLHPQNAPCAPAGEKENPQSTAAIFQTQQGLKQPCRSTTASPCQPGEHWEPNSHCMLPCRMGIQKAQPWFTEHTASCRIWAQPQPCKPCIFSASTPIKHPVRLNFDFSARWDRVISSWETPGRVNGDEPKRAGMMFNEVLSKIVQNVTQSMQASSCS